MLLLNLRNYLSNNIMILEEEHYPIDIKNDKKHINYKNIILLLTSSIVIGITYLLSTKNTQKKSKSQVFTIFYNGFAIVSRFSRLSFHTCTMVSC